MPSTDSGSHRVPDAGRGFFIPRENLIFSEGNPTQELLFANPTDRALRLQLEVLDSKGAFTVEPKHREVSVRPKGSLSVPVRFTPRIQKGAIVMTSSAEYHGRVHVWNLDTRRMVGGIGLSGVGIGLVEGCGYCVTRRPRAGATSPHKGNSPPVIQLTVQPQMAFPGEIVNVTYTVTDADADEVHLGWSFPSGNILPISGTTGEFTGAGDEPGHSIVKPYPPSDQFEFQLQSSTTVHVWASNAEGLSRAHRTVVELQPLGYWNARTLGGIQQSYLDKLTQSLWTIDQALNSGCIRNHTHLDWFNDPYLRNGLTDDILENMKNLLIYPSPQYQHYGVPVCINWTSGNWDPGLGGIAVCLALGADHLTILHELYHLTAYPDHDWNGPLNGCKAAAVAQGCFLPEDNPFHHPACLQALKPP